jgi:hypothetical protein
MYYVECKCGKRVEVHSTVELPHGWKAIVVSRGDNTVVTFECCGSYNHDARPYRVGSIDQSSTDWVGQRSQHHPSPARAASRDYQ